MSFSIRFDYKIVVAQPDLTKGMLQTTRERLNLTGDFIFTPQKVITGQVVTARAAPDITSSDITDDLKTRLDETFGQLSGYAEIIDKRCKHITVKYNPNKKSDESITEACSKIFGNTNGVIDYNMYVGAITYLQKLDKFLAHKSIENNGII